MYHLLPVSSSSALTIGSAEQSLVGCGHSEGVLATVPLALGLQVGQGDVPVVAARLSDQVEVLAQILL